MWFHIVELIYGSSLVIPMHLKKIVFFTSDWEILDF